MSTIKVIAPLSPAGEFPVTDAQNISFESGTVATALEEIQQKIGGEGGNSDSLNGKLESAMDGLNALLDRLGHAEQLPEIESLYNRVKAVSTMLGTIQSYLGMDSGEGVKEDVQNILDAVNSSNHGLSKIWTEVSGINTNVESLEIELKASIGKLTSAAEKLGTDFAALSAANAESFTGISNKVESKLDTLDTNLQGKVDDFKGSIHTDFEQLGSSITGSFGELSDNIIDNFDTLGSTLTNHFNTETVKNTVSIAAANAVTNALTTQLNSTTSTITNQMSSTETVIKALINTGNAEVKDQVTQIQSGIRTSLNNATSTMNGTLAATTDQIQGDFGVLTQNLENQITGCTTALNAVTETISDVLSDLTNSVSDLRGHINTISPPTLSARHDGASVYEFTATPTLTITASVNRPLESPLKLTIDGRNPTKLTNRSWSTSWSPRYSTGKLPFSVQTKARIVNQEDEELIYAEQTLTCTFGTYVYHWVGSDTFNTTNSRLSAGHPGNTTFTCTGSQYCFYAAPEDYGTPTFTVSGTSGGFSKYTTKEYDGILYNIYRSNNQLNSITVNIK